MSEEGATEHPKLPWGLLLLPKQLSWSPLQELGGGDGSMVAAGERRQKEEAALGKGNV